MNLPKVNGKDNAIPDIGKVSIVIPCRNEEFFIGGTIDNILSQDYPSSLIEIIIIDGLSTDNTTKIISKYMLSYDNIKLLINKQQVVPHALNMGIKFASGNLIIRMDAHCSYPNDYVSKLVYYMGLLKADNVGGIWITKPSANSIISIAIAEATSNIFGIGNAHYRLQSSEIKEVDTVPFGCYRKEIFNDIGLFDTDLIRNQDDEFNARLIKNGGKIYLIPSIKIEYFARATVSKMSKMFYQYGLFKPLVNRKIGTPTSLRQFFPVLFLVYLLSFLPLSFISIHFLGYYISLLFLYLFLSLAFSIQIAYKTQNYGLIPILPIVFILIHTSYGLGYLIGVFKFYILHRKNLNLKIQMSR